MIGSQYFVAHPRSRSRRAGHGQHRHDRASALDQLLYRSAMAFAGIDAMKSVGLVGARHYPQLRALADAAFAGAR